MYTYSHPSVMPQDRKGECSQAGCSPLCVGGLAPSVARRGRLGFATAGSTPVGLPAAGCRRHEPSPPPLGGAAAVSCLHLQLPSAASDRPRRLPPLLADAVAECVARCCRHRPSPPPASPNTGCFRCRLPTPSGAPAATRRRRRWPLPSDARSLAPLSPCWQWSPPLATASAASSDSSGRSGSAGDSHPAKAAAVGAAAGSAAGRRPA